MPLFPALLTKVWVPLMHRLGELWAAHQLGIASEHFATVLLKQQLLTLLHTTAPGVDAPVLLCACPAGEDHELGLLTFAYFMQQAGWRVWYAGPDLPLHELHQSCEHLRPALVALSLTHTTGAAHCLEIVQQIDTLIAPTYPTFVGGQAMARHRSALHPRYVWLCDTPHAALSQARLQPSHPGAAVNAVPMLGDS